MSTAELANAYAALILADEGIEISVSTAPAEKLSTIIKAAGIPEIEPIWSSLFAKALEGKDVKDLLLNVEKEESDDDMGFAPQILEENNIRKDIVNVQNNFAEFFMSGQADSQKAMYRDIAATASAIPLDFEWNSFVKCKVEELKKDLA
ncbi:hypothetical protein DV735_g623, partial [Chaetothyriales sp. CBS 134920]